MTDKYFEKLSINVNRFDAFSKEIIRKNRLRENIVVIFDIDETLIHEVHPSNAANSHANVPIPINKMQTIYNRFARQNNWTIFLMTGRPERTRRETEDTLFALGFKGYAALFMRPNKSNKCICKIKMEQRKYITNTLKFTIVLNVGDQDTDFVGGYYEQKWQMPNMYTGSSSCTHVSAAKAANKKS